MHTTFLSILQQYTHLGIPEQIDYKKFYLYSLITHSTAIEGSTVTEIENQLLFDQGITAPGRTLAEQMMNLDLKRAYEQGQADTREQEDESIFSNTMFAIHQKNLSAEIAAFCASTQSDVSQNVSQNVSQKALSERQSQIRQMVIDNSSISAQAIAHALGVNVRTIYRDLKQLNIHWIGSPKSGHWKLI